MKSAAWTGRPRGAVGPRAIVPGRSWAAPSDRPPSRQSRAAAPLCEYPNSPGRRNRHAEKAVGCAALAPLPARRRTPGRTRLAPTAPPAALAGCSNSGRPGCSSRRRPRSRGAGRLGGGFGRQQKCGHRRDCQLEGDIGVGRHRRVRCGDNHAGDSPHVPIAQVPPSNIYYRLVIGDRGQRHLELGPEPELTGLRGGDHQHHPCVDLRVVHRFHRDLVSVRGGGERRLEERRPPDRH
jgi:hypothetical protein